MESTTWTVTAIGPPLGGVAISVLGPVVTIIVDAVSYLRIPRWRSVRSMG